MEKQTQTVWRIVDKKHRVTAFSGQGAALFGGRFNYPGLKVVYTVGSLSLAILEMLVQTHNRDRLKNHICIPACFDKTLVELVEFSVLPTGWDDRPYSNSSQHVGSQWLKDQRSLVLQIPSVVIPLEFNYLINPVHPAFSSLQTGNAIPASMDVRLIENIVWKTSKQFSGLIWNSNPKPPRFPQ